MAGISIGYPKPKQSPFDNTQYAPSFVSIDSVTLTKDEDGRLVRVEYSSGREVEITYDDDGNVLYTEDGAYKKTLVYSDEEVIGMEVTKL